MVFECFELSRPFNFDLESQYTAPSAGAYPNSGELAHDGHPAMFGTGAPFNYPQYRAYNRLAAGQAVIFEQRSVAMTAVRLQAALLYLGNLS